MKNILVCTSHKGVFFGQVADDENLDGKTIKNIKNARMALHFGTTKGVMELCDTGPTKSSIIGAKADIERLHDVTVVFNVSDKAAELWMSF